MLKKLFQISLLIVSIVSVHGASAQDIPVLEGVAVETVIEFDKNSGLYKYSYSVSNPATNTGQISTIQVDISKPPQSQELSGEGLIIQEGVSRKGKILETSFKEELASYGSRMRKPIVPVGIDLISGWLGNIAVMGTVHWGAGDKESEIAPGAFLGGFNIISRGMPAIREISIEPWWVYECGESCSDDDDIKAKEIEKQITFKTKTIGPTAPPKELNPVSFINGIISMKHEAYTLGWITNKGIETSLDQKLDNAKKKLEQGNNTAAKNILNAFINEVEAQGCESYETKCPEGKHLKPEAYALLKYNAKYLVDNLK